MGVKMPSITVKEYADHTPRKSKLVEKGVSFRLVCRPRLEVSFLLALATEFVC